MRSARWIATLGLLFGLAGCFEPAPKFTADEEKLVEAVMYLFTGLEDNLDETSGKGMPWQRAVKGRTLEYWRTGENQIYFSDEETNRKMRESKYVRYAFRLSSPERCVFSFQNVTDFSKGNSRDEFLLNQSGDAQNTETFNLANAHTFVFEDDDLGTPYIRIVGPRAVCGGLNFCENAWNSVFSPLSLGRFRNDEKFERRRRAFKFVKKACPGREF